MNKHKYYLEIASTAAKRSKCVSLHVGCVLVKGDQVISTGVNGTPAGYTNCCDHYKDGWDETHHEWSKKYEIHAEQSALLRCEVSTKNSTAYITHSPCFECVKQLIAGGVKSIYFTEKYHRMTDEQFEEVVDFCKKSCVGFIHVSDKFIYHSLGQKEVKYLFDYKEGALYYKRRGAEEFSTKGSVTKHLNSVGGMYGTPHGNRKTKYIHGSISNRKWLAHTLIWIYHYGRYPKGTLDHIDGDGTNNQISNLREATPQDQCRNHPKRINNSSGFNGVTKRKDSGKWVVYISGKYDSQHDDLVAAIKRRKELNLLQGYHENHGR